MKQIQELTDLIRAGGTLNTALAMEAAKCLAGPEVEDERKQEFLIALSLRGETAEEVAAFAATFRDLALNPELEAWAPRAIDVCGTGGDGAHTFNISTAVSFIVAAAGIPVLKHGNRSITSKCGSADLLEAIGIQLEGPQTMLSASLEALNFCFLFAPAFHPAFKAIMPVRKALAQSGQRTIFNLLGPLINPGRPAYQLLGVFSQKWVEPLAEALHSLGLDSGLVAHCVPGLNKSLDELSCAGLNYVSGFGSLRGTIQLQSLKELGLEPCTPDALKGGNVATNVSILNSFLSGDPDAVPTGLSNSILLNAGVALWISGKVPDLPQGLEYARELVDSRKVLFWLKSVRAFYAKY